MICSKSKQYAPKSVPKFLIPALVSINEAKANMQTKVQVAAAAVVAVDPTNAECRQTY